MTKATSPRPYPPRPHPPTGEYQAHLDGYEIKTRESDDRLAIIYRFTITEPGPYRGMTVGHYSLHIPPKEWIDDKVGHNYRVRVVEREVVLYTLIEGAHTEMWSDVKEVYWD